MTSDTSPSSSVPDLERLRAVEWWARQLKDVAVASMDLDRAAFLRDITNAVMAARRYEEQRQPFDAGLAGERS